MSTDPSPTQPGKRAHRRAREPTSGGAPRWPDRYEDRGLLGVGGEGEVRRVYDRALRREVAMKLLPGAASDPLPVTVDLQHPSIVTVLDLGRTSGGGRWITMPIVVGDRLDVRVRAGAPAAGLVRVLAQVASALAYAHDLGATHGDVSPANVMVGVHDEVRLLDWGGVGTISHGGTPGFAAPELLAGEAVGPAADVYGMGALLALVLTGRAPYAHPVPGVVVRWQLAGRPPTLMVPQGRVTLAEPLLRLVQQCLGPRADRPHIEAYREALEGWLDGSTRHAEASRLVQAAVSRLEEARTLREQSAVHRAAGRRLLAPLSPWAPASARAPGWARLDDARGLVEEAALLEGRAEQALRTALQRAPDHMQAVSELAALQRARLVRAENERDPSAPVLARLIEHEGPQSLRDWLSTPAMVCLDTRPSGLPVALEHIDRTNRRWVGERVWAGVTPLEREVPPGSYRLVIEGGCGTVRVPVVVGRGERWMQTIDLPEQLADGVVMVPGGTHRSGADPDAVDALPMTEFELGAFAIQRDPVTWREYADWLVTVQDPDRERWMPRARDGRPMLGEGGVVDFGDGGDTPMDAPVSFVDFEMATAYARDLALRTGIAWRLPHELEWERAAQGADGRHYPWGDHFEASWAVMAQSHPGRPSRRVVGDPAEDISVYGVRGMAGNVRDWCANAYSKEGPPSSGVLDPTETSGDPAFRMQRGGNWSSTAAFCRIGARFGTRPERRLAGTGFRLAYSIPPEDRS